jgi:hypothetical protein
MAFGHLAPDLHFINFRSFLAVFSHVIDKIKPHQTAKKWRYDAAFHWWAIKDSNLGPTGYEPVALTN